MAIELQLWLAPDEDNPAGQAAILQVGLFYMEDTDGDMDGVPNYNQETLTIITEALGLEASDDGHPLEVIFSAGISSDAMEAFGLEARGDGDYGEEFDLTADGIQALRELATGTEAGLFDADTHDFDELLDDLGNILPTLGQNNVEHPAEEAEDNAAYHPVAVGGFGAGHAVGAEAASSNSEGAAAAPEEDSDAEELP